jgi:hypothetical protein
VEAALQAVQPPSFGRRRVPPSLPGRPDPEREALAAAFARERARLRQFAQFLRPKADQVSTWLQTLFHAGVPLSGMMLAGVVAVGRTAGRSLSIHCRRAGRAIAERRARPSPPANPLLDAVAQSGRGLFVRTLAYLGAIAVLSVAAADVFQSAPVVAAIEPPERPEWIAVAKPYPAFHLTLDAADDHRYEIRRHAEGGGRKDILSWGIAGQSARHLTIEIYRPGTELDRFLDPASEIKLRALDIGAPAGLRPSFPLETKFGPLATVDFAIGRFGGGHCVGLVRAFEEPRVQISALACNANALVDRGALACALDRLALMSAGSDPEIAKLFAQAELKRNFCGQRDPILYATPRRSAEQPKSVQSSLRGRLLR